MAFSKLEKINYLIKFGGSLSEKGTSEQLMQLGKILNKIYFTNQKFVILPGGGEFAEKVRQSQKRLLFSDEAAHWMAIKAMELHALLLQDFIPNSIVLKINSLENLDILNKNIPILKVMDFMRRDSKLEHNWNVTSDAIAIEIANYLGLRKIIFLKDIDGINRDGELIPKIKASDLKKMQNIPLDKKSPNLLIKNHIKAIIINGLYPERIEKFLKDGTKNICTEIVSK
ncbi:MAG TPA: hypothetical protein VMX55_10125 [candidate division Zixibacteria bacterium]|nr:hypothetical protein [candidate division Zixibacteria bacterium]